MTTRSLNEVKCAVSCTLNCENIFTLALTFFYIATMNKCGCSMVALLVLGIALLIAGVVLYLESSKIVKNKVKEVGQSICPVFFSNDCFIIQS